MQQDVYEKNYELENRYWWYVSRRYVFDKVLRDLFRGSPGKRILDIGCGSGGAFSMLQKYGEVFGLDISPQALEFCRRKGFRNVALMKGFYDTGYKDHSVDLVTLFDALEHFEDDGRAIREARRILRREGFILLSVPAFRFLWSDLDDANHHFRRYTRKELDEKLRREGFEVVKSSYIFFFLFFPVFLYKLFGMSKRKRQNPKFRYQEFPSVINWVLTLPSMIEAFLLGYITFPFGSTLVVFARKKN